MYLLCHICDIFRPSVRGSVQRFLLLPTVLHQGLPPGIVGDSLSGWKSRSTEGVSAPSCGSADDLAGDVYTGEDDRMSPVRVMRVFGGGLQASSDL